MHDFKRLAHAIWDCKYHIVWCPKYRFQILKGEVGRSMREIIRQLCRQKGVEIIEGNVQVDHIHLVLSMQVLAVCAGILMTVGLVAGFVPAWRASRVDPIESLRYE